MKCELGWKAWGRDALIIGIGGYEHLREGAGTPLPNLLQYGNLGQLTSPPRSALAIATALQSPALDWQVPLGTVDLLVSTAPEDPDPSGDRRAVRASDARCYPGRLRCVVGPVQRRQENVAFCYVAGHGLEGIHHDRARVRLRPVRGTGLGGMRSTSTTPAGALTANKAQTQIFLVDACREITTSNVEVPDAPAPALRTPAMRQPDNCNYDLTIMATSRNHKAYGPD